MAAPSLDVVPIWLRLPRREIAYVKFIFESYEGVAVCRTIDPNAAVVTVLTVPDFRAQAEAIIDALEAEGACTRMDPLPGYEFDLLGGDD
jgi:hypothetical protein